MPDNHINSDHHSGFIAIIGAPNAGKSTLLNQMVGQKIAITSQKPQTTRNRILGVLNRPHSQLIFIDTPGMHTTEKLFNARIVEVAISALDDVDQSIWVVDATLPDNKADQLILRHLKQKHKPVVLALNKIDRVDKPKLLTMIGAWQKRFAFKAIVPVSAKTGEQVDDLVAVLETYLPKGPPLYPEDHLTDMPEQFIAAEMIREKVFRHTGQEIPYATAVTIETFKDVPEKKLVHIDATIHVERPSQKMIVIGKKGAKLKEIGQKARLEIEKMLGTKVFLNLFVRIEKNWSRDSKALRKLGY